MGIQEGRDRLFWPIWASLRVNKSLNLDAVPMEETGGPG